MSLHGETGMFRRNTTFSLEAIEHGPAGQAASKVGGTLLRRASRAGRIVLLFLDACGQLPHVRRSLTTVVSQIEMAGVGSILVLSLIAFLTGSIMAVQTGAELVKIINTADNLGAIIGATFVRELGPIWAAIIMLARVGAAMAAQLGTMAVNEEIDALRVMSINPVRYLVMPRILALVIAMPLLTTIADWVGMAGGAMISSVMFNVSVDTYMQSAKGILTGIDFFSGLAKSAVFGAIIATIACDRGMHTTDGAEGVGRSTTEAVVLSVVWVLIADLIMTSFIQMVLY
jgi:phospholipid/cholesterol/gamma-HCH transport system permease protein